MTTDRRVAEQKIEHYRRQLANVKFWRRRRNLIRLLAAEEEKLRCLAAHQNGRRRQAPKLKVETQGAPVESDGASPGDYIELAEEMTVSTFL